MITKRDDMPEPYRTVLGDIEDRRDTCPHETIVPYDDGRYGRCTKCLDGTFPLVDEDADPDSPEVLLATARRELAAARAERDEARASRDAALIRLETFEAAFNEAADQRDEARLERDAARADLTTFIALVAEERRDNEIVLSSAGLIWRCAVTRAEAEGAAARWKALARRLFEQRAHLRVCDEERRRDYIELRGLRATAERARAEAEAEAAVMRAALSEMYGGGRR